MPLLYIESKDVNRADKFQWVYLPNFDLEKNNKIKEYLSKGILMIKQDDGLIVPGRLKGIYSKRLINEVNEGKFKKDLKSGGIYYYALKSEFKFKYWVINEKGKVLYRTNNKEKMFKYMNEKRLSG